MPDTPFRFRVLKGPEPEQGLAFQEAALTFGSAKPANVIFPIDGVAACHARVSLQGGRLILEDLGSSTGTFRNGQQLLAPLQIFSGDEIGLGSAVVLLLEGGEVAEDEPSSVEDVIGLEPGAAG